MCDKNTEMTNLYIHSKLGEELRKLLPWQKHSIWLNNAYFSNIQYLNISQILKFISQNFNTIKKICYRVWVPSPQSSLLFASLVQMCPLIPSRRVTHKCVVEDLNLMIIPMFLLYRGNITSGGRLRATKKRWRNVSSLILPL